MLNEAVISTSAFSFSIARSPFLALGSPCVSLMPRTLRLSHSSLSTASKSSIPHAQSLLFAWPSNRQILIPPPITDPSTLSTLTRPLQPLGQIRSHDRHTISKARDSLEELAKEDENAIDLDDEANEWPAEEDEQDTEDEREAAAPFLAAREEEEGAVGAEEEGYAC